MPILKKLRIHGLGCNSVFALSILALYCLHLLLTQAKNLSSWWHWREHKLLSVQEAKFELHNMLATKKKNQIKAELRVLLRFPRSGNYYAFIPNPSEGQCSYRAYWTSTVYKSLLRVLIKCCTAKWKKSLQILQCCSWTEVQWPEVPLQQVKVRELLHSSVHQKSSSTSEGVYFFPVIAEGPGGNEHLMEVAQVSTWSLMGGDQHLLPWESGRHSLGSHRLGQRVVVPSSSRDTLNFSF